MHIFALLIVLASPLSAQLVTMTFPVVLDTTKASHRAVRDSLLAWRADQVRVASTAIKVELDSVYAVVLDSTGITLQTDRLDDAYVRVQVPATERLLVAARAQWLLDGAVAAEGDTIRATKDLVTRGLARLAQFY